MGTMANSEDPDETLHLNYTVCLDKINLQRKKSMLFFLNYNLFVCFDSLLPSQQFLCHVWTGLPGLNQY